MGAWGMGVFDDDISCDAIDEAMAGDLIGLISTAEGYMESEYLQYHECLEVLVVAAILDSLKNGTVYEDVVPGYDSWIRSIPVMLVEQHSKSITKLIQKVLSDKSELHELWQENEENYPTWKSNVNALLTGLSS